MTFKPPIEMTQRERIVKDYVLDWIEVNTKYESLRDELKTGRLAMDWCFKEFCVPSFEFEILSKDYELYIWRWKT